MPKKYAIIVAGGSGTRMGGDVPKQFQNINGRPMLWWTLRAFHREDPATGLIVVLNPLCFDLWKELQMQIPAEERIYHLLASGGTTRTESVINGLALVADKECALVAVHDAARPAVSAGVIGRGWETAEQYGAAVPVVPVVDSLRKLDTDDGSHAVDRSQYVAVQTPQVFDVKLLKDSYASAPGAVHSDDATAVEFAGHKVALFPGDPANIKVTNPGDFERVSQWLNE